MQEARLIFKNNTPFSLDFEDFYFSSSNPVAESKFIYSEAFEFNEQDTFIIAELGFGIGLNFFLSLQRFLRAKIRPKRLFYVSLEGFYIKAELLRTIYQKLGLYEEFKELLEPFLEFYPKAKEGIYRFYFEDCFLDLVFKQVSEGLKELDFKADVWFLDGFAPARNEAMFSLNVVEELARLSKLNASVHTFSAASSLQKALKTYNFQVQKLKGYAKREMIRAYFKGFELKDTQAYYARTSQKTKGKKIAIIGAGIAGASLAYELSLRGFELSVFEKNTIASGASGNEAGILSSLILKKGVALGAFSEAAFYEASRFYKRHLNLKPNGVFEFAYNEAMQQRFASQKDNLLFKIEQNKAFLEEGLSFNAKEVVQALLVKSRARLFEGFEFENFKYDLQFNLCFKNGKILEGFDILILAMGADIKDFLHLEAVKLSSVRGQISHLKPFLQSPFAFSSRAYIAPSQNKIQVIGASYDRLNTSKKALKSDDLTNIANIQEFLKGDENLELLGSRVAFRSYSSDRFPLIGTLYDEEFYKNTYKNLLWHKNKPQKLAQNIPNLYLSTALGSRGFAYAIIAARVITALINEEPLGFCKSLVNEAHPARFLIRKLKKGLF